MRCGDGLSRYRAQEDYYSRTIRIRTRQCTLVSCQLTRLLRCVNLVLDAQYNVASRRVNFDDDVDVIELPLHGHAAQRCFRNAMKDISLRGFSLGQSVAYILE